MTQKQWDLQKYHAKWKWEKNWRNFYLYLIKCKQTSYTNKYLHYKRLFFTKLNQKENWEDIENQNGNLISLKTLTPKDCENRYNNNDNFKSRNKLYTLRKEERFK